MTSLTKETVIDLWNNSSILRPPRQATSPDDWGDQATVGMQTKTDPRKVKPQLFGIYLGRHKEGYVIALNSLYFEIVGGEAFDSIEEMKERWMLD